MNALANVESIGGRDGAVGPDYFQIDVRAGWRGRLGGQRAIELFLDIFNITDQTTGTTRPETDGSAPSSS